MRILYVIHNLNIGGAENIVTNYLIELKKLGHDVCCVQLNDVQSFLNEKLSDNNVPVYTLIGKVTLNYLMKVKNILVRKFLMNYKLNSFIKYFSPDIIHFHTYYPQIDKIKFDYNRIFFTFHTTVERALKFSNKKFPDSLANAVHKGMNIIAISNAMKDDCLRYYPDCKVKVIYNGVDIKNIQSFLCEKECVKRELGIEDGCFVLGHVGRFNPVKNHSKIIDIFEKVCEKRSDSILLLVGDGTNEEVSAVKKMVQEKNLNEKVVFLGNRTDVSRIMSSFDAFVLPSKAEGFSLVALEAQALMIRTILSDVVPDDVVVNNNCFKLSPNETSDVWADYVLQDFKNEEISKDIMVFDISSIVKQHETYYEKQLVTKGEQDVAKQI